MHDRSLFELVARIGYAARGVVYLIVGMFAALAAVGAGARVVDDKGAFLAVLSQPFGELLLAMLAAGFLCFAAWQLLQAVADTEKWGTGPEGIARRAVYAASAIFHAGMALWAASIILGWAPGGGDTAIHDWTAWLMRQPLGRWLVAAVGIAVAGTGVGFAVKGYRAPFQQDLALAARPRRFVVLLARAGHFARAIVFVIIGFFSLPRLFTSVPARPRGCRVRFAPCSSGPMAPWRWQRPQWGSLRSEPISSSRLRSAGLTCRACATPRRVGLPKRRSS